MRAIVAAHVVVVAAVAWCNAVGLAALFQEYGKPDLGEVFGMEAMAQERPTEVGREELEEPPPLPACPDQVAAPITPDEKETEAEEPTVYELKIRAIGEH